MAKLKVQNIEGAPLMEVPEGKIPVALADGSWGHTTYDALKNALSLHITDAVGAIQGNIVNELGPKIEEAVANMGAITELPDDVVTSIDLVAYIGQPIPARKPYVCYMSNLNIQASHYRIGSSVRVDCFLHGVEGKEDSGMLYSIIGNSPDYMAEFWTLRGFLFGGHLLSAEFQPVETLEISGVPAKTVDEWEDYIAGMFNEGGELEEILDLTPQVVNVTDPTLVVSESERQTTYVCGELTTLQLSLTEAVNTNEITVIFTSGETPTEVLIPADAKGPDAIQIKANTEYCLSILNGIYICKPVKTIA